LSHEDIDSTKIWDSSNLAESFPGIVLPLTFSIARRGYELAYKSQAYSAGLDWFQLEANHRTFNAMTGLFAGRMYYDLVSWYKFIGLFPNNKQNQKYLDEQLETLGSEVYLPAQNHSLSYKLSFWIRVAKRAIFFERERKKYWLYLDTTFKYYDQIPKEESIHSHLNRYSYLEQMIVPHMGRAVDNDFFVMSYNGMLKKLLRKWLGESTEAQHDFLGALHDVISTRQATLLLDIATYLKSDQKASLFLKDNKYDLLDKHLISSPVGECLQEYRSDFLHRYAEDQKIESVNPLGSLQGFYSFIRTYMKLSPDEISTRRNEAKFQEKERTNSILKKLNTWQRIIYKIILNRLKNHLRIREKNRLYRGKVYAHLRELFIQFGKVLNNQKILDDPKDVHYLDIEELFQLINGSGYSDDFKGLVSARKTKYESYKEINAPHRFITKGALTELPKEFHKGAPKKEKSRKKFKGIVASPGVVYGKVMVLEKPIIPTEPFDILVVSHTDPGWTPLIALSKGLIVERGGILSHAAIVTRELGIPSIIGIEGITTHLRNGQQVKLDATTGVIEVV